MKPSVRNTAACVREDDSGQGWGGIWLHVLAFVVWSLVVIRAVVTGLF